MQTEVNQENRPIEYSPAKTTNFRVFIEKFPFISFYTTDIVVPAINIASTKTRFSPGSTNIIDNVLEYDPLTLGFIVDENYKSYMEIYNWMILHGSPTSGRKPPKIEPIEVYVAALDNNKKPLVYFKFIKCVPISLSELSYNSQSQDNEPLTADITMMYEYMQMTTVTTDMPTNMTEAMGNKLPG